MSDDAIAMQAARKECERVYVRDGFLWSMSQAMEFFMAGAAWATENNAKLVSATIANPAGVERRARDRDVGNQE